jgi:sulfatase modifying factor 1
MKINGLETAKAALACGVALMRTVTDLHADTFGSGGNQFTIDFVTIGDPGNSDDRALDNTNDTPGNPNDDEYSSPHGGVAQTFRIGTYEVSREMITKANNAGNLGITLADMTSYGGNVGTHPATGITWNEAARFVNWLNTSNGFSAAYKFTLQPGDGGYSANSDIELWTAGDAGFDAANPYRNSNAFYFLPSEDEWYKAAYYSGSGTTYFDYATASNAIPTAVVSGTASGTAVYHQSPFAGPADIDNAGGLNHYGTMGQNGNVWELYEKYLRWHK